MSYLLDANVFMSPLTRARAGTVGCHASPPFERHGMSGSSLLSRPRALVLTGAVLTGAVLYGIWSPRFRRGAPW